MMMACNPPPRVIHIKIGNMKMNDFHRLINIIWDDVLAMSKSYKLVKVFESSIEGID